MSAEHKVSEPPANESGGTLKTPCPLHGCKRVYSDRSALDAHIKDHDCPAQSLPGKVLLCSMAGCSSSFPNMKKLMEHMRHHHKPNIFFLCESCRTKLRSYRGLLTHLHTCSKVPRAKPKVTDAAPPSINTGLSSNLSPVATNQNSAPLDSRSKPQETTVQSPRSDSSVPQTHTAAAPPLAPTVLSSQDGHPEQQLPDDQDQPQTQNRFPALAPKSSPGPTVIWKKNQGVTYSKRILWEHTKGRYACVQCGHTVSNRAQMSQHISSHHRAAEDAGSSASNT